jgi:carbonic anhydrase
MSEFPPRLVDGYRDFVSGRLTAEQSRYRELADHGQSPEVMVIGCCDSRVSPEVIFDAHPGELFVVRNVANLVPPYAPDGAYHGVSAALEFAVQALRVKHIVVLGHARCGGIRAYVEHGSPLSPGDFIGKWMSMIAPAAEAAAATRDWPDYPTQLEHASIVNSISNLMTFPCISILVGRGKLHLHGAYFDVSTGRLEARDPDTGRFEAVAADEHALLLAAGRRS